MLVAPFSIILLVLFYYDVRIRSEGYDLEMMTQQLLASAPATAPASRTDDSSWPL